MVKLHEMVCVSCSSQAPVDIEISQELLSQLHPDWKIDADARRITKRFSFKNFWQTMGFVNAVAWIVHQQNHHPDLMLGFNYCQVSFTTHSIQGLSKNDFICAAKIDRLSIQTT